MGVGKRGTPHMGNDKVVSLTAPAVVEDALTEMLRTGARRLIEAALAAELKEFLTGFADEQLPDGRQRVVRSGHPPDKAFQRNVHLGTPCRRVSRWMSPRIPLIRGPFAADLRRRHVSAFSIFSTRPSLRDDLHFEHASGEPSRSRERAGGRSRRRAAPPSSVRRSIPVRTFSDWDDPAPGFAAADLVAHSGPVTRGSFVQTLVVTDIATGWTECAPVLYREQTLLREVLGAVRRLMPFELLGFDTDNDSVFINETLRDYCRDAGIVFTRCRPWRKNDQAFVEQKNGAVVRRIVGYRRLEGLEAAAALSEVVLVRWTVRGAD